MGVDVACKRRIEVGKPVFKRLRSSVDFVGVYDVLFSLHFEN